MVEIGATSKGTSSRLLPSEDLIFRVFVGLASRRKGLEDLVIASVISWIERCWYWSGDFNGLHLVFLTAGELQGGDIRLSSRTGLAPRPTPALP